MKVQAYIYHKRAEKYSDCQDYFGINFQNNRIAVSDGMSQSTYPQWWAKILVEAFLSENKIPYDTDELQKYQDTWLDKLQKEIYEREKNGINPWRLKDKLVERSGAGATLCGFSWEDNLWKSEIIGDSSLILVREDFSIEIKSSQNGEFGNHPDYLDSFNKGKGQVKYFQGQFDGLITMLLVSDPFSELFHIHQYEKDFIKKLIREIRSLTDHNSYTELVERWRDEYAMHNDDSTLVVLTDFSTTILQPIHIDKLEELCLNEENRSEQETERRMLNGTRTFMSAYKSQECISTEPIMQISDGKSNSSLTRVDKAADAKLNYRIAAQNLLNFYDGKLSKRKIIPWFTDPLHDIISVFLSKK